MIIRCLIVPLTFAALALVAGSAFAQDTVAAPPPGSASEHDACMNGFVPLRQEAEQRGRLIKAASERRAPPEETCKLIGVYGQAELKMIKYVETYATKCGISPDIADRLKTGHRNTDVMQRKVCAMARQAQNLGPTGPVGDFDEIR